MLADFEKDKAGIEPIKKGAEAFRFSPRFPSLQAGLQNL